MTAASHATRRTGHRPLAVSTDPPDRYDGEGGEDGGHGVIVPGCKIESSARILQVKLRR